jgi:hypothetical protein
VERNDKGARRERMLSFSHPVAIPRPKLKKGLKFLDMKWRDVEWIYICIKSYILTINK